MRLTEKYDDNSGYGVKEDYAYEQHLYIDLGAYENCIHKLGQLEDIEEELGIDLVTLFKALKQDSIWVKEHNTKEQEIVYERVILNFLNRTLDFVEPRKEIGRGRNLSGYGETWALTKEELE